MAPWKGSRFQYVVKALPLPSGYFHSLDHPLPSPHLLCAALGELSWLKREARPWYSLYRIFDKAYIRLSVCLAGDYHGTYRHTLHDIHERIKLFVLVKTKHLEDL